MDEKYASRHQKLQETRTAKIGANTPLSGALPHSGLGYQLPTVAYLKNKGKIGEQEYQSNLTS